VDLNKTINLETVVHLGPSTISIDTIQRSRGTIPDIFLRGAGVSEQLLTCIHSSGRAPFDYHTCFISYSNYDQRFVQNLYQDLRKEGKGKREVLVPICLDRAILSSTMDWAVAIRKRQNIRSFVNWQQTSHYQKMLKDLLEDLRKE
jgi:hypothetical protein